MMGWETCRALVVETCAALAVVAATAFTSARIEAGAVEPRGAGLARIGLEAAAVLSPARAAAVWTPAFGVLAGAAVVDHGQPLVHIDRLLGRRSATHDAPPRSGADRHVDALPDRPAVVSASMRARP